MESHAVQFQFGARYFTSGIDSSHNSQIWFVLHGYGQLAPYFLPKFEKVVQKGIGVVAPEGLSRFYLEDVSTRSRTGNQKVGASWMTRENREMDISNYITYLNSVYRQVVPDSYKGSITLLGFSQGAATAARWMMDGMIRFDRLILWAGLFPPDIDFTKGQRMLAGKRIIEVMGQSDPFLTDEKRNEMRLLNEKLGIQPQVIEFNGGHELNDELLLSLC